MAVPNLNPSNPPRTGDASLRSSSRSEAGKARPLAAAAAAAGVSAGRFADRIERTPEFQSKLDELKLLMDRQPDLHPVDLEAIRRELSGNREVARDQLVGAALGILHGELRSIEG